MLTHFLTSQPALIKLDNENIGGHLTPLQSAPTYWYLEGSWTTSSYKCYQQLLLWLYLHIVCT